MAGTLKKKKKKITWTIADKIEEAYWTSLRKMDMVGPGLLLLLVNVQNTEKHRLIHKTLNYFS